MGLGAGFLAADCREHPQDNQRTENTVNGEALFVLGSLSLPTKRYVAVDEFEQLVGRFEARPTSTPASRLDVLIDLEYLGDSRVVRFMLQVLADASESREVRIYALKWLIERHFAPEDRRCVAHAICRMAADRSRPDTRVQAVLALAEFADVDGVQTTLGDLALDANELIDIRYCAFTSLQKAGPTTETIALTRLLSSDNLLGGCARDALSLWRTT
jgi:hypothetical protein